MKKTWQELATLNLCQTIQGHKSTIWTMKFSKDNKYLATGDANGEIRIWKVRVSEVGDWNQNPDPRMLEDYPLHVYTGHKSHVVDLSWSSSNFLLSASLDMTVRLWHVSKPNCLCIFQHSDMVTSVDFHPTEDNYFLTGCMDSKLRIWNILEGKVMRWIQAPSVITSASFCPGGMFPVAFVFDGVGRLCSIGLVDGQVSFYYTDGLRYFTQIECRNHHGKDRKGRKVCSIAHISNSAGNKILVSTNDSRLRLIGMDNFSLLHKYKGHTNRSKQLAATLSNDYKHIISPSEDGYVYIWRTADDLQKKTFTGNSTDRSESYEYFKAVEDNESLTGAIFAPNKVLELCRPGQYNKANNFIYSLEESVDQKAMPSSGFMIVTTTSNGYIRIYESFGKPKKM